MSTNNKIQPIKALRDLQPVIDQIAATEDRSTAARAELQSLRARIDDIEARIGEIEAAAQAQVDAVAPLVRDISTALSGQVTP